jgi:LmbE family N-acetylglucosaminyl deacetylase
LSENLGFGAHDRVLVFAPHPDDESIATAGLLQLAQAAGAQRRVVVVTDGDNNPWPQRWIEKRWTIDAAARARWGERRRSEARAACGILGVGEGELRFLGLPDLGLTDLLMKGDRHAQALLAEPLDEFAPTHIALPALMDRHPDHSAVHAMLGLLLAERANLHPTLLTFAVHGNGVPAHPIILKLDDVQRETKARAILAHATQMRLSGRRFLAYARPTEMFDEAPSPTQPDATHPLRANLSGRQLHLHVDRKIWGDTVRGLVRFVIAGSTRCIRAEFSLPGKSNGIAVRDTATGGTVGTAMLETTPEKRSAHIVLPDVGAFRQGFVKLGRREPGVRVFDRFGWQIVDA